jgi:CubicO group peptidase (beta-lactamase class C family)
VPDGDSIYEIGSITKVFTAVLLAGLEGEGSVELEAPIEDYLPDGTELPEALKGEITLLRLATHTSGLPRLPPGFFEDVKDQRNPYAAYAATNLLASLEKARLRRPGRRYEYSNLGFGLLGHVLSLHAGEPYGRLVLERICVPLERGDTGFEGGEERLGRLIPGHEPEGGRASNWDFDVLAPAGGLRSTVSDLLTFLEANMEPEEGAGATVLERALLMAQDIHYEGAVRTMGLGWQIARTAGGLTIHWHNGGTGGYATFAAFDRENGTAVVILSNYGDAFSGDDSVDAMGMEILKLAARGSLE